MQAARPRARAGGLRPSLPAVLLLALLMSAVPFLDARRAVAGGLAGAELVLQVTAAYPPVGTLAVAVARQQVPDPGLSLRAAEARAARLAAGAAGNAAADRRFPTASMVKLFMAEDILHRARTGALALRADDGYLLREMIRTSDDPAASTLWVRYGGGRMVTAVAARYDLPGTSPPPADIPGQWGQAVTTAGDLARFLSLLPSVAHPDDAAAIQSWMRAATPIAADGFDQQFGVFGTAPPETAVKQGWMCCVGGNRHLHSVGVVGSRVVVLLSEVPRGTDVDTARRALTAAAAAVPAPSS